MTFHSDLWIQSQQESEAPKTGDLCEGAGQMAW